MSLSPWASFSTPGHQVPIDSTSRICYFRLLFPLPLPLLCYLLHLLINHHSTGFPIFFFSCLSFTTLASKHQRYYFPCWILFCSPQLFLQNESQSLKLALKSPSSGSSSFISWHNSTHSMLWLNQTTYTFWPQHVLPSPGACSPTLLACRTPVHLMASGCEALPDPPKHNYSSCPLRHCRTITVTGFLTAGVSNHLFAWVFPADWISL